jgi:hypothetical protein
MPATIIIDADPAAVETALASSLSAEERAEFSVEQHPRDADPFDAPDRGEAVTFVTVMIWTGQAVASGVVGGIAYDLLKKTSAILQKQFGEEQVQVDNAPDE